jgi:hypothetical protein
VHDEQQERAVVEESEERNVAEEIERRDDQHRGEDRERLRPRGNACVSEERDDARNFVAHGGDRSKEFHGNGIPRRRRGVSRGCAAREEGARTFFR